MSGARAQWLLNLALQTTPKQWSVMFVAQQLWSTFGLQMGITKGCRIMPTSGSIGSRSFRLLHCELYSKNENTCAAHAPSVANSTLLDATDMSLHELGDICLQQVAG